MENQSIKPSSAFLTSVGNQASIKDRCLQWQHANASNIASNTLFSPEAQRDYDKIVQELALCLIAFVGCGLVSSKLPSNKIEFEQQLLDNSKLGKWCLWHIDPRYVELIVERLDSLRNAPFDPNQDFTIPESFNPYDLLIFKIPQQIMGADFAQRAWVCPENIAQIRNQPFPDGSLVLTALAYNQRNEDTAAELSKILEPELSDITADIVVEFAECYGLNLNADGKLDWSKQDKACFNMTYRLLKEEFSCGLYALASFSAMVLVNYQMDPSKSENSIAMRQALGHSLQALGFPRNSEAFMANSMAKATKTNYQKALDKIYSQQSGLECKKDDDDKNLDWVLLEKRWHELSKGESPKGKKAAKADDVLNVDAEASANADTSRDFSESELALMREFIDNLQSEFAVFSPVYHRLCFINWDNKLERLFEAKSTTKKKLKLSKRLLEHFENLEQQEKEAKGSDNVESLLDEQDIQAIELTDIKRNNLTDDERTLIESFFNEHRIELEQNSKLYTDVEALSCKSDVNCTDFFTGLSELLLNLYTDQKDIKSIEIKLDGLKEPEDFFTKHNFAMSSFFSIMYSPLLRKLCTNFPSQFKVTVSGIKGDLNPLLDFNGFYGYYSLKGTRRSELKAASTSKNMLTMEFKVTLGFNAGKDKASANSNTGKLIWRMDGNSVGLMLSHDLELISSAKEPLKCVFGRSLTSLYGRIKSLDLNDLSTFMADASLSQGAFIADSDMVKNKKSKLKASEATQAYRILDDETRSLTQIFTEKCEEAEATGGTGFGRSARLNLADVPKLLQGFKALSEQYLECIQQMQCGRFAYDDAKSLLQSYAQLQMQIMQSNVPISLRRELIQVVQSIGIAYEQQDTDTHIDEFAVATPYNIFSMYNHTLHTERVYDLVNRMLSQRLFIDKRNVVFSALHNMQNSQCGPEVVASTNSKHQQVLQAVQSSYGYTLYQSVEVNPNDVQLNSTGNLDGGAFERKAFVQDDKEQIESALEFMERYVIAHPHARFHFNVMLYDCEKVDLLLDLYNSLCKSEFFAKVKIYLYVVNRSFKTLSNHYQRLNDLKRSNFNGLDSQVLNPNIKLCMRHVGEVAKLKEDASLKFDFKFNQGDMDKPDDEYFFNLALSFHVCDSQAQFNFDYYDLPLTKNETELFHSQTNFARYRQNSGSSNLFLISPEQNLYGMVYLHALHYVIAKVAPPNEVLERLSSLLSQDIESGSELSAQPDLGLALTPIKLRTPVPNYRLVIDRGTAAGDMLQYVHTYAKEVVTFDALLTRTQFQDMGIRLVQYHQPRVGNTSTFMSTNYGLEQSYTFLRKLLQTLKVEGSDKQIETVLNAALDLSGGLILHSQIAEIYTNEMLGLVLSKHIVQQVLAHLNDPEQVEAYLESHGIKHEQGALQLINQMHQDKKGQALYKPAKLLMSETAYFMLDEYNSWFGSKTGEIADILGLNLCEQENGRFLLRIVIAESKFCQDNPKPAAGKSLKQTKATAESFFSIFSHDNAVCTVDRQIKMRQLSAMLSRHDILEDEEISLEVQQALQSGTCDISITALSFVYVYQKVDKLTEQLTLKSFDFGSTEHNTMPLKPQAIQMTLNEQLTKDLLREFLDGQADEGKSLGEQLLEHSEYREFLERQIVVPLDALPSEEFLRKADYVLIEGEDAAQGQDGDEGQVNAEELAANAASTQSSTSDDHGSASKVTDNDNGVSETQGAAQNMGTVANKAQVDTSKVSQNEGSEAAGGKVLAENDAMPSKEGLASLQAPQSNQGTDESWLDDDDNGFADMQDDELASQQPSFAKRSLESQQSEAVISYNQEPQGATGDGVTQLIAEVEANGALSLQEKLELRNFFTEHGLFAQLIALSSDSYKEEIAKRKEWAAQKQVEMIKAFEAQGLQPVIESSQVTPNGALFRFKGNTHFESKRIEHNRDFYMTAYGVKIDKVMPVVGAVEISIHNDDRSRIALPYLSLFKQRTFNYAQEKNALGILEQGFNSKFLLGMRESSGELAYIDLKHAAPHTLIAGGTGSGKSNLLNILLLDIALTNHPDDLELILMDPKNGAEFGIFRHLPHVKRMVFDMRRAVEVFNELVDKMEERYKAFTDLSSKLGPYQKINDIDGYNRYCSLEVRLPRIIVVIDEFADWFGNSDFKDQALSLIQRLGAKARAAGIHLILATQRPDKDVVDVQVRSNLGNQIALKTRDENNSAIILGASLGKVYDASKLLGKGHMICNFEGQDPFYGQSAYIDNETLGLVVKSICDSYEKS